MGEKGMLAFSTSWVLSGPVQNSLVVITTLHHQSLLTS
jgi:hypothetical protein